MDKKDFSDTLSYCLYICDDEEIKNELFRIQILFTTDFAEKKDLKRLKQLEKLLQKQFRD
jgi:hypothetical protein